MQIGANSYWSAEGNSHMKWNKFDCTDRCDGGSPKNPPRSFKNVNSAPSRPIKTSREPIESMMSKISVNRIEKETPSRMSTSINACGSSHMSDDDSEDETYPSAQAVMSSIGANLDIGTPYKETTEKGSQDESSNQNSIWEGAAMNGIVQKADHITKLTDRTEDKEMEKRANMRTESAIGIGHVVSDMGRESEKHHIKCASALIGAVHKAEANNEPWDAKQLQEIAHARIDDKEQLESIVAELKSLGQTNARVAEQLNDLVDKMSDYVLQHLSTFKESASHHEIATYLTDSTVVMASSAKHKRSPTDQSKMVVDLHKSYMQDQESIHSVAASELTWQPDFYVREDTPLFETLDLSARSTVAHLHKHHHAFKKKVKESVANAVSATAVKSTKALFEGKGDVYKELQSEYLVKMKDYIELCETNRKS